MPGESEPGDVLAGRYTIQKIIGKGSFGAVYRAADNLILGAFVALKVQRKNPNGDHDHKRLRREHNIHARLSLHPNVVAFLGMLETPNALCFVLEYMHNGDLQSIIGKEVYLGRTDLIKRCFLQLVDAVAHCHAHGVYHRDIKPANILVSDDYQSWLLTDFGLAAISPSGTSGTGTKQFMAPEALGAPEFSTGYVWNDSADVWALGMTLIAVTTGLTPWSKADRTDRGFVDYLTNPSAALDECHISPTLRDLLLDVFSMHPLERPTLVEFAARLRGIRTFYAGFDDETTDAMDAATEDQQACDFIAGDAPPVLVVTAPQAPDEHHYCRAPLLGHTRRFTYDSVPALAHGSTSEQSTAIVTPETHPALPSFDVPTFALDDECEPTKSYLPDTDKVPGLAAILGEGAVEVGCLPSSDKWSRNEDLWRIGIERHWDIVLS
ncbi:kinase-like protein [Schizophyllum commune Tattone D]|nr:kinase-like protein [Schizophyllum commune Tattone D]